MSLFEFSDKKENIVILLSFLYEIHVGSRDKQQK